MLNKLLPAQAIASIVRLLFTVCSVSTLLEYTVWLFMNDSCLGPTDNYDIVKNFWCAMNRVFFFVNILKCSLMFVATYSDTPS